MQNENQNKAQEQKSTNKRYQPCGALWKRKSADGRGYLSGRFTMEDEFGVSKDYSISVWPNRKKTEGDNLPDFTIDYDTQKTKDSPARKKPEAECPASSLAAQNKAEEMLDNPFKDKGDNTENLI